ncbi:iron-containing redox enzyme family protein [Rickettsiales endosymbiont of Stachyamoeba lipophora]|uniref:iron-containing redox enzyme family protein n=1 Tax=Rickettsiales endosymbiont of Stachyamoeba lipophora TaxID=2486578 RepID=UPI0013DDAE3C|nr:iron-containing redox enzyme family protein [Rickettsiales endosymbiont of Stachyamoeba lipophora]
MKNIDLVYNRENDEASTLLSFLNNWDANYQNKVRAIDLFKPQLTSKWAWEQKAYFCKIFYHARGHFHEFLWYLGNHAEDKSTKDMVLHNMAEEFNGSARSHEQLYLDFAETLGVKLDKELIEEESYLPCIKEFNKEHLRWLHTNDHNARLSAFSAYERLDNIDYINLLKLVDSMGVNKKGQIFFKVHALVKHFETTEKELQDIWNHTPEKVIQGFNFISEHQIKMWHNLSNEVFNLNKNNADLTSD